MGVPRNSRLEAEIHYRGASLVELEGNSRGPDKALPKGEKAPRSFSGRKAGGTEVVTVQN